MPRYSPPKLIRRTNKLGPQLCRTNLTGRKRYVMPRYCRRQLVGPAKWQASQPCLTNLTSHISDTTVPNAEPGTESPVLFAYANKSIIVAKRVRDPLGNASISVYAVNTIGFPTKEKLEQANVHQLSIAIDEWCGGCPIIMSYVGPVLARDPSLVITADPRDLANMASSIARVLDVNDPSDTVSTNPTSALLLAGCITAIVGERGDVAIATTTLLESTIRYFLALAPLFGSAFFLGDIFLSR